MNYKVTPYIIILMPPLPVPRTNKNGFQFIYDQFKLQQVFHLQQTSTLFLCFILFFFFASLRYKLPFRSALFLIAKSCGLFVFPSLTQYYTPNFNFQLHFHSVPNPNYLKLLLTPSPSNKVAPIRDLSTHSYKRSFPP